MQSSSLLGTGESRMLAKGAVVTAEDGTQYTVGDLLGHGGQGEVYRISGFDGDFALKWYYSDTGSRYLNRINSDAFRKNLEKNVHDGVPTTTAGSQASQFIWPLKMVPPQGNGKSFGYIMNLYKPGYYKFSEIIMGMHKGQPLHMKSWNMLVTAALNIVRGFEILHAKGLSYQDLNEGGVFINPETGDVMICDCDNVSPTGYNLGIKGVVYYMAPEVVRGEAMPDKHTDKYSLAVILFRLFYGDHPLMGVESSTISANATLTSEQKTMMIYGTAPHYCLARNGQNPPNPKRNIDVINRQNWFPVILRRAFEKSFVEGAMDRSKRLLDTEWRKVLCQVRDSLVVMDGKEQFYFTTVQKPLPELCRSLHFSSNGTDVLCWPGKLLYPYHFDPLSADYIRPVAQVRTVPGHDDVLCLYNASGVPWQYIRPDGVKGECPSSRIVPIISGMKLIVGKTEIEVN